MQVYDVMEALALESKIGYHTLDIVPLDGLKSSCLGYAQVLFVPAEALKNSEQRLLLKGFLTATFEGWTFAAANPEETACIVQKVTDMLFSSRCAATL